MHRPDWDTYFILQAEIAKLRSNCLTRHIGAVIVKDNRQIATGYNGTPSGIKNCFEGGCPRCMARVKGEIKSGEGLDRCMCTHAEANAIMQCALFGNDTNWGRVLAALGTTDAQFEPGHVDVAMNDVPSVRCRECRRNLDPDVQHFCQPDRAAMHALAQRLTFNKLGGNKKRAV